MDPDNQVLIEGVLFRARYLGSTQLATDNNPTKLTRMLQAQEAVGRIKAPDGESQPSVEVDLFVSTEKIMVLNTDLQVTLLIFSKFCFLSMYSLLFSNMFKPIYFVVFFFKAWKCRKLITFFIKSLSFTQPRLEHVFVSFCFLCFNFINFFQFSSLIIYYLLKNKLLFCSVSLIILQVFIWSSKLFTFFILSIHFKILKSKLNKKTNK